MTLYRPAPTALRQRFWMTTRYLAHTLLSIGWWEVFLPHRLHAGMFTQRDAAARREQWARDYRAFALRMGGVWIKLGQFISARADLLPPEITDILADLQDEVQPIPWVAVESQVRRELGAPPEALFAHFERRPVAAASLGQVHLATLEDGREVAVKVQRPGIRAVIDVDLEALRVALGWLRGLSFIRRRVNLDALYDEFAATLRLELDYMAEGRHAEQFRENFQRDRHVEIPRPYWPLTTMRVLTLERVEGIKISDFAAIEATGVRRGAVAEKLFQLYLKQVFEDGFFHADPHPGNLYVRPRAPEQSRPDGSRDFDLIFIDFGMVGHITDRSRTLLRRMVIATVARDYPELVRLAKEMGFLLPDVDTRALVPALESLFERFYGLNMAELTAIDVAEIERLANQFRDLLYQFPFQLPQDFIFLGRTLAILSGIATGLDPNFSPVEGLEPFARRLIGAEAGNQLGEVAREASELAGLMLTLPRRAERLLRRVEDGDLAMEALQPALDALAGIEGAFNRLTDTILLIGFAAGYYFTKEEEPPIATGMVGGILWVLWRQLRGRR